MKKFFRKLWQALREYFDPQPEPEPKIVWHETPLLQEFDGPVPSGWVSIVTKDIQPRGRADNGGLEFFFESLFGPGFDRLMLANMGEGRGIRFMIDPGETFYDLANPRDLMGTHKWLTRWDSNQVCLSLDGRVIASGTFTGQPDRVYYGGHPDGRRCFKGKWSEGKWGRNE